MARARASVLVCVKERASCCRRYRTAQEEVTAVPFFMSGVRRLVAHQNKPCPWGIFHQYISSRCPVLKAGWASFGLKLGNKRPEVVLINGNTVAL